MSGRRRLRPVRATGRVAAGCLIFLIQTYRHMVSPLRPASCRFIPTCSQYAVDALTEYGVVRASWLTAVRLAKCGPWHRGGWDPIPERLPENRSCRADVDDAMDVWGPAPKQGESESFV
ncbi:membrane protein insertion efficiency factor YidD [Mycobacterium decipiens]|uniref:Putative membrane protein insertion efficiency factor n=1 Tax=Mycobacterium decipiens TaxID=1430326 RepID=A0A1X2LRR3_9MYCO|nr:membrane protein insertion efficiency factor YidD [Mycobacterium decipiens]OSC39300.1 membrane protein insertion efficiency factor YidD [Mycobacterium decipiens]